MPSRLRVVRENSPWQDRARKYKVILDDHSVGEVENGSVFEADVTPGPHSVRLKINWNGSPEFGFEARDEGVHEFGCDASGLDFRLSKLFSRDNNYIDFWPVGCRADASRVAAAAEAGDRAAPDPRSFPRWILPVLAIDVGVLLFAPRVIGFPVLLLTAVYTWQMNSRRRH